MYDRDSLTEEIADAIDSQPTGEITVRWRTQNGQRRVELARVANWDPAEGEVEQLRLTSRSADNAEAVAVYRRSVAAGTPLSERVLARWFGRSKGWARDRIQEARDDDAVTSEVSTG